MAMTDWNHDDPDAIRVHYDLSAWNFDQQAELAAALADAELPHGWDGSDLVVPEEAEERVDAIIDEVERRLGIVDLTVSDFDGGSMVPVKLDDAVPTTEYDLADWTPLELQSIGHALTDAQIPFRWDSTLLLVGTDDEAVVDALLDEIERGDYSDVLGPGDAEAASPEELTSMFLAAERLRREPRDPDGLDHLVLVGEADPDHPPFGVTPRLWSDACALVDRIADALAADTGPDEETAMAAAGDLYELLRPHV
jgi:hypothetical protein